MANIRSEKKSGPPTVLSTDEEKMIVAWLLQIASMGFPITRGQLIQSIQLYLNKTNRNTKFIDNLPGRKWYDGFMHRHPIISQRTSQNLTASRAAITEKNCGIGMPRSTNTLRTIIYYPFSRTIPEFLIWTNLRFI